MPSLLDGFAGSVHFLDHLSPVVKELGDDFGSLWVTAKAAPAARREGLRHHVSERRMPNRPGRPVLVASWGDVPKLRGRGFWMVEHGAGQKYAPDIAPGTTPDYDHSCGLIGICCPNETVAERNRIHHPHAVSVATGCPKLDRWTNRVSKNLLTAQDPTQELAKNLRPPVVAFAFHHDCRGLAPEARWAFPHWQDAIASLAKLPIERRGYDMLGHGHPRAISTLGPWYKRHRVEWTKWSDEVLDRADVLVCDNSSLLWEACAVGIPVVLLDAPYYRPDVDHGLRFWEMADAGIRIGSGRTEEVHEAIMATLESDPCAARRAEVAHEVYGELDGKAAVRAADAIRAALGAPS